MHNIRHHTWRNTTKFQVSCTKTWCNELCTEKCTKKCNKEICVYQVCGMFLLIVWIGNWGCKLYFLFVSQNQNIKKIQFFNKFYCAMQCALCCAVLCSVVNFLMQLYLTLSWRRPLSYRNQATHKSIDWFLYDNSLRHERVEGKAE